MTTDRLGLNITGFEVWGGMTENLAEAGGCELRTRGGVR